MSQGGRRGILTCVVTGFLLALVLSYFLTVHGVSSDVSPLGLTPLYFNVALQVVLGLWFGFWGCLGVWFGASLGFQIYGLNLVDSFIYGSVDFIQAFIPVLFFRLLRRDESLAGLMDWLVYLVSTVLLTSLVAAYLKNALWVDLMETPFIYVGETLKRRVVGYVLSTLLVSTPLLVVLTPFIKKSRIYIKYIFS